MAARHPLALVVAGIAVAVAAAGCATAVTGSPIAATTFAATTSPATSTATSPATSRPTTQSPATTVTSAPASTAITAADSSGVRPMPPVGTSSGAGSSGAASSSAGTDPGTIAGVDLATVLARLDRDHVASVGSTADMGKLAAVVDDARAEGLELSVVSIGRKISNTDTSAISQRLFTRTGGTLVVLSPTLISARSDQLTDPQRDAAIKAAAKGKDDVQSVTNFVGSALKGAGLTTATTKPSTPKATTTKSTTTKVSPTAHPKVNGVDIDSVAKSLGADHIHIADGVKGVTAKQVGPEVQKAWKADLKVYVAFLATDPSGHLYDVSSAVMDVTGGTVIVISPKRYAISSETIKNATLQKALDSAADEDSYQAMVSTIIDTLLAS